MAEKSKMSVADILAAARKADSKGSPPADDSATDDGAAGQGATESQPVATEEAPATEAASSATSGTSAPKKPIPKSGSGRPSVAEMLAMARGEKKAAGPAADKPKPAAAPSAKKEPAKPAAKKESPKPTKSEPVDTQSILAAARKANKPGPMTKAEAAAKGKPVAPKPKKPKEEVVVPPMPVKPDYAKPSAGKSKDEVRERRVFLFGMTALATGFAALSLTNFLWTMGAVRFMFPNIIREPPNRFKVGFPDQFPPGQVETKFKAQFGVWVVNTEYNGEPEIYALKSVCTHLGCTPNWLEAEQKFKCPCHGSGFYKNGINFEGPAPRPLERYAISIADDGQIEIDKSRIFQEEMGQWTDSASYLPA